MCLVKRLPDFQFFICSVSIHWVDVTVFVRMFPFPPNGVVSPVRSKAQTSDSLVRESLSSSRSSAGWGVIVSGRHEDAARGADFRPRKQDSFNDDVFMSSGNHNGYVYSANSGTESQASDEFSKVLGQRRTDKNVTRSASDRRNYSDSHWALQSYAVPSRSCSQLSFSTASMRLCQSCNTRITNSVSLYGSRESLVYAGCESSADIYSTICSVFWKMSLTFHPFVSGADNQSSSSVEFSSLWPNGRSLACLLPEICTSVPGSIEALCRIAIFADVVKLLNALIDLNIVGMFVLLL